MTFLDCFEEARRWTFLLPVSVTMDFACDLYDRHHAGDPPPCDAYAWALGVRGASPATATKEGG